MKLFMRSVLAAFTLLSLSACSSAKPADTTAPEITVAPVPSSTSEATPKTTPEVTPEVTPEATPEPTPTPTSEPTAEPTPAARIEFTAEGSYKLFGVTIGEMLVASDELEVYSDIVLDAGGTGSMSFNGESADITKWELNEDAVSITMADGDQGNGKIKDGIFQLDLYGDGNMVLYFAQEGADISRFEFSSLEEVQKRLNMKID